MSSKTYKFSCALFGHSLDVRSVSVTDDGHIISGSRDKTAKIWKPNGFNPGYTEAQTLKGHTNFVSCVCVLSPDNSHPNGLILTGGNDNSICAFTVESPQPLYKLLGHSNAVCCLSAGTGNRVLSASWDCTARIWKGQTHLVTLTGHSAAVWCVGDLPGTDISVTGSADKTLKLWKDGKCQKTLTGHTDCVRDLAPVSSTQFLSCANDATIRHWTSSGECLATYYGHSNYIYSVAVLLGQDVNQFVTSGEDRTIRIWKNGECHQTIYLPTQSVWTVTCQKNGDIVAGSSDGVVRVFSADPDRQASPDVVKVFEEEVAASSMAAQQELGGVKISDLPGREALYEPGRQDGQTKLVREGDKVFCYSWSSSNNEWTKIGDVVGAAGGTQSSSGKTLYEGKEYDYVFSVDIEDGKPPLKLPYDISEDPWFAAQKFIHKNDLSQMYLDQVANFIITNTKAVTLGEAPSTLADPFTGGNRYIPNQGTTSVGTAAADPFTGGSRYIPGSGASAPSSNHTGLNTSRPLTGTSSNTSSMPSQNTASGMYFPQKTYIRFDQANLSAILEKLQELNKKTGDGIHTVQEEHLDGVVKLAHSQESVVPEHMQALKQLLEWPQDIVFPVLDITRLAIRNPDVNFELCTGRTGDQFIGSLRKFLKPDTQPANQMLTLRILCNMLSHEPGEQLALRHWEYLLSVIVDLLPPVNRHVEVALVTLLLNLAVAFNKRKNADGQMRSISVATAVLPELSDGEAQFRGLVGVGTMLWNSSNDIKSVARDSELNKIITKLTDVTDHSKVSDCAHQVKGLFV